MVQSIITTICRGFFKNILRAPMVLSFTMICHTKGFTFKIKLTPKQPLFLGGCRLSNSLNMSKTTSTVPQITHNRKCSVIQKLRRGAFILGLSVYWVILVELFFLNIIKENSGVSRAVPYSEGGRAVDLSRGGSPPEGAPGGQSTWNASKPPIDKKGVLLFLLVGVTFYTHNIYSKGLRVRKS